MGVRKDDQRAGAHCPPTQRPSPGAAVLAGGSSLGTLGDVRRQCWQPWLGWSSQPLRDTQLHGRLMAGTYRLCVEQAVFVMKLLPLQHGLQGPREWAGRPPAGSAAPAPWSRPGQEPEARTPSALPEADCTGPVRRGQGS